MNDIFISYSSADRPWATQLANDLRAAAVTCFLDTTSIRKGEGWERQILGSLNDSRHLVVIWTSKSGQSDWVNQELYRFKANIDPNGTGQTGGRLLYAINLEGQNPTLSGYQQYDFPSLQEAYRTSGAGVMTLGAQAQQDWTRMVREIAEASTDQNPRIPVSKVVFAPTKGILQADQVSPPVLGTQAQEFLEKVGITGGDFKDRYGDKPEQWKPYGTQETIEEILDELLHGNNGVNAKLRSVGRREIKWVPEDLVTPPTPSDSTLRKIGSGPCLLVIDPISLFIGYMSRRFNRLAACFTNPSAAIVLMTPFKALPTLSYLRECLTELHHPSLEGYCEPIPYVAKYANCDINVSELWEIRRLVLASLGRQPVEAGDATSASNPFTRV